MGFTTVEVDKLLTDYGQEEAFSQIKEWYGGYLFGRNEIYNQWSVLNFLSSTDGLQQAYWSNTSSNNIVRTLIEKQRIILPWKREPREPLGMFQNLGEYMRYKE